MIEKKLEKLKSLMTDLDQDKLKNSHKIDSISLISENLSRSNKTGFVTQTIEKFKDNELPLLLMTTKKQSQIVPTHKFKLAHKTQSLVDSSSPQKTPRQFLNYINETNKQKMTTLAKRLFTARCLDMKIKQNEVGWQEFLKTFLIKNSKHGEFKADKIDISGLGIGDHCLTVVNEILSQFRVIDLSRNIIRTIDISNVKSAKKLQELVLRNCGMKNEQLCTLFKLLLSTKIKRLSLCSPHIKDRNNLTKYDQLYELLQKSETLQCLEISNIQISPDCQIFAYAKKSVSLKRLDISKNTGVEGMCKNLIQLNLSWNGIKKPNFLRCNETRIQKLDLTGNPIPSYSFQDSLNTNNYSHLKNLILNKIQINYEAIWLQTLIEKSKSIEKLSLVDCELSKITLLNVIYGLEHNKSLRSLNLSGNKIPSTGVAEQFVISLKESNLSHLYLQLCEITDECGSILFQALRNNSNIEYIDVSKNMVSQKTSETICSCLKTGCYSLLTLITTQNFIKYDQLKEIVGYISRNAYMSKMKVLDQYRKYKNMNANNAEFLRKLDESERRIQQLREETLRLQDEYMKKQKQNEQIDTQILQQQLQFLSEQQNKIQTKKTELEQQLKQMMEQHPQLKARTQQSQHR